MKDTQNVAIFAGRKEARTEQKVCFHKTISEEIHTSGYMPEKECGIWWLVVNKLDIYFRKMGFEDLNFSACIINNSTPVCVNFSDYKTRALSSSSSAAAVLKQAMAYALITRSFRFPSAPYAIDVGGIENLRHF